ncbi:MAG: MGMT family protein [Lysobacteraceae bacterium]|jgi:methylated-DNA-protein-cysteine methyltransferase-like protein|nr:MGMT family protein [Xanthomonadaceae bacterium]MCZ8317781.1 MGMT family protein [Silanimonas sp.]
MADTPARRAAAILAAVRAIPRGEVRGYGEVAAAAGLPGRARLVARVLAEGDGGALPWHRVLRSDGRIAFPDGSDGFQCQVERLRAEGVTVEGGRVRRPRAVPRTGLDALLWVPRDPPPPSPRRRYHPRSSP